MGCGRSSGQCPRHTGPDESKDDTRYFTTTFLEPCCFWSHCWIICSANVWCCYGFNVENVCWWKFQLGLILSLYCDDISALFVWVGDCICSIGCCHCNRQASCGVTSSTIPRTSDAKKNYHCCEIIMDCQWDYCRHLHVSSQLQWHRGSVHGSIGASCDSIRLLSDLQGCALSSKSNTKSDLTSRGNRVCSRKTIKPQYLLCLCGSVSLLSPRLVLWYLDFSWRISNAIFDCVPRIRLLSISQFFY